MMSSLFVFFSLPALDVPYRRIWPYLREESHLPESWACSVEDTHEDYCRDLIVTTYRYVGDDRFADGYFAQLCRACAHFFEVHEHDDYVEEEDLYTSSRPLNVMRDFICHACHRTCVTSISEECSCSWNV